MTKFKTLVDFAQALANVTGRDIRTMLALLEQLQAGTLPLSASSHTAGGASLDGRDCRILLDLLGKLTQVPPFVVEPITA